MPPQHAAKVAPPGPRKAEVLGALSLAMDLGLGQQMEHVLRTSVVATALSDHLGLTDEQRGVTYYAGMVSWIGCIADSPELASWFGDDIAYRYDTHLVDSQSPRMLAAMASHVGRDRPALDRVRTTAAFLRGPKTHVLDVIVSHCSSAVTLSDGMSLDGRVGSAVESRFERWDGKGLPLGLHGDAIPAEIRVVQLADLVVGYLAKNGRTGLHDLLASRDGGQLDPEIVDAFSANLDALLALAEVDDVWAEAMSQAPDRGRLLEPAELVGLLEAIGDFVDLRSTSRLGHSRRVAELAAAAGLLHGLGDEAALELKLAGHIHDLGRVSVPSSIWDKPAPLNTTEMERVRLCAYYTRRIVRRVTGLQSVADLAGAHAERCDGSGHPNGVKGRDLTIAQKLLAAADVMTALRESRAHRSAMDAVEAARVLGQEADAGRLDAAAVDAVLHAAGQHERGATPPRPGGLTPKEVEVLRLLAQGNSTPDIARALGMAGKTARNHVQRIYSKIGASNRTGASMFALRHGLVDLERELS